MPVLEQNQLTAPATILEVSVGSRHLGIRIEDVKELIQPSVVSQVPKTHSLTKGVFRLRDSIYPLIDLTAFLNESAPLTKDAEDDFKYVLIKQGNHIAGLFVHAIHDITTVSENDLLSDEPLSDEESLISFGFAQGKSHRLLILNAALLIPYIKDLNKAVI